MQLLVFSLAFLGLLTAQTWATDDCPSSQFECDNDQCIFDGFTCDGIDNCGDNSDEEGCLNILGLVIGVSIAGFIVFLVVPITICVIIWCCVAGAASQAGHAGRTTYVGTAAPTTAATVVSTTAAAYPAGGYNYPKQFTTQEAPPPYPGPQPTGYPLQSQPQPGYPPQPQPGYPPQPQPGYPPQPDYPPQPGYPPQEGYSLQQTAAGYPTKEVWQAPPEAPPGGYPPQQ